MTTRRDRIEAVLAGRVADRLPITLWRHWPGDDQDAESHAAATLWYQQKFDWDFIKVTTCGTVFHLQDWGVETRIADGNMGSCEVAKPSQTIPESWQHMRPINVREGAHGEHLRCLNLISAALDRITPFIFSVFAPTTIAARLLPVGQLPLYARRSSEHLNLLLEIITETLVSYVKAGMQSGAAGVFYATNSASHRLWSASEHTQFANECDLIVLDAAASGWLNVLHLCGSDPMLEDTSHYPVHVVNWDDRNTSPSLAEAKNYTRLLPMGGIDQRNTLLNGSPSDVSREVVSSIQALGGAPFIVSAGCSIPATVPHRNLRAARQAVEAWL